MTKRIVGLLTIFGLLVGCAATTSETELAETSEQGLVVGGDENCKVSCGKGYFACCNENGEATDTCNCWPDGTATACTVGGPGAASCESPGFGGKAATNADTATK